MRLGVVIVTYNRLKLLKECINACISQTKKFEKIYVINNASTDGTKEYLNTLNKIENLRIINLEENKGGSGGFYEGLKRIENEELDYVLLIDDDAIIDTDFNKNINIEMEKKEENIVAYSGTVKTNNQIQYNHRSHMKKEFKVTSSGPEEYDKPYFDYEIATFCGLFVKKSLIKEIGLPRKDFFIWYDDSEYSLRIIKKGKIRNINSAFLNHKTTINTKNNKMSWKNYYGYRNRIVIYKTYFSKYNLKKYCFYLRLKIFLALLCGKKYDVQLIRDALNDGIKDNMGKNEKYQAVKK